MMRQRKKHHTAKNVAKLRDANGCAAVPTACGFALDWLDLDDDELAETLASTPDDIRERITTALHPASPGTP